VTDFLENKMDDTLVVAVESGLGFELHADEESVCVSQDEALVALTWDEAKVLADALIALVYGEDEGEEEDEEEYYSYAEDEV
jgi:hypothetical protein